MYFIFVSRIVCVVYWWCDIKWNKNGEICTKQNGKIALKWKAMKCICGEKESNCNIWRIIIASVITEIWKKNNQHMHRQWNSPIHLLYTQMICTALIWLPANGSMHIHIYLSLYLARIPLSTMQWSYIFYTRERSPNILYNILGLYRAVLVRES